GHAIAAAEVNALAKQRLALWIKQVGDAHWSSFAEIRKTHRDACELDRNRVIFSFSQIKIEIEVISCFSLGIIYIDRVSHMDKEAS
ncbi:MAG: hypothetical protein EOP06_29065, partial [Proteobacteria bacterium]